MGWWNIPEKYMELHIKVQKIGNLLCISNIHSKWVSLRYYSDNKSVCSATYCKINQGETIVSDVRGIIKNNYCVIINGLKIQGCFTKKENMFVFL